MANKKAVKRGRPAKNQKAKFKMPTLKQRLEDAQRQISDLQVSEMNHRSDLSALESSNRELRALRVRNAELSDRLTSADQKLRDEAAALSQRSYRTVGLLIQDEDGRTMSSQSFGLAAADDSLSITVNGMVTKVERIK